MNNHQPEYPPDSIEQLLRAHPITRRSFLLKTGAAGIAAAGLPTLLGAYGGSPTGITLHVPTSPMFVDSYAYVPVEINGEGLTIDDLDFVVVDGAVAGSISLSKDVTFDPNNPSIMLLGGYKPGVYTLNALKKGTSTVVATALFQVTDLWTETDVSPSRWFNGIIPASGSSPTWGTTTFDTPQNYRTIPALGTRRIAVILVDTADQRLPTGTAYTNLVTRWRQEIFDGFVGSDGVSRSVSQFYREVSYSNLTVSGQVISTPVHLAGHFTDYIPVPYPGSGDRVGDASVTYSASVITAIGNTVDLTSYNLFVFAIQGIESNPPRFAWPYGGSSVSLPTSFGTVTGRTVSMPIEWGPVTLSDGTILNYGSGRTYYETVTHEMGHTLNLPDEYHTPPTGRNGLAGVPNALSDWDPMDNEGPWPYFTIAHRMMLGWIPASWLKLYNFMSGITPASGGDLITLSPIERGAPPAGQYAGVEVRIADGLNYYFEYRRGQTSQLGDRSLSPVASVVGTEVRNGRDPDILMLANQPGGSNAVLSSPGQFYHEIDTSSPTYPADFRVDLVSINSDTAVIRVQYGVLGRPDPSIRPWPRDASNLWQSPDIEVRNARSEARPADWFNVPWVGHTNTIYATIKNRGNVSAPGVVVDFFYKDFTVTGAPEHLIGSDTQTLAPDEIRLFTQNWVPPAPGDPTRPYHYCVIVRIRPYTTPGGTAELSTSNNEAQSNYTRFISATASPASREIIDIIVSNPYDQPADCFLVPGQNNPLYRTYLEHYQVHLDPQTTRKVRMMMEYAPDAPLVDDAVQQSREKYLQQPNNLLISGYLMLPGDGKSPLDPDLQSGAQIVVVTGRKTMFESFTVNASGAGGQIVTVDDKQGVPGGNVIVILTTQGNETSITTEVDKGGNFHTQIPDGWEYAEGYYVPLTGYGDCTALS